MEGPDNYLPVSRLIVGHLTGALTKSEERQLERWVNASVDHLRMMAEFSSICWHAREARRFEEADKQASWSQIQKRVAQLPDAPPLPDLQQKEWG
jgi:hypothetical protein